MDIRPFPAQTDDRRTLGSYWEVSVPQPRQDRKLHGNALFDVAVIGAGFAGLSAALRLAEMGISVCVLEAEHVGFGASGRNGGFCCLGGTKLDARQLVNRFGLEEARKFLAFQVAGINLVAQRLDSWGVDADRHSKGEMLLAHRAKDVADLKSEAEFLKANFGIRTRFLSREELFEQGYGGPSFHGGLHVPYGFALNPMAYVQALADRLRRAGGKFSAKRQSVQLTGTPTVGALKQKTGSCAPRKLCSPAMDTQMKPSRLGCMGARCRSCRPFRSRDP